MRARLYFIVALLTEVLSWLPLALGYIVGVLVASLIMGYQLGHAAILPPTVSLPTEEDED